MQLADMNVLVYNYEFKNVQTLNNNTMPKIKRLETIDMNYVQAIPIEQSPPTNTTITSIEILGEGVLPTGYTKEELTQLTSIDVSSKEDNSIVAYYDGSGKVYVYSESKIAANSDASGMFSNFINLATLDLSNLDTSNVTSMYGMFIDCSNLTSLDLSNADFSNVSSSSSMFCGCNNLTEVKTKDENAETFITERIGVCLMPT